MARRTVEELVNGLAAGRYSLNEVVEDFRTRDWPRRPPTSDAQAHGVVDMPASDPNSWDAVNACSRLKPEQYAALLQARRASGR